MSTFIDVVNQVLIKLRESQVSSTTESDYSTLIAGFVNDTAEEMHDKHEWDVYETTISFTQTGSAEVYTLTGSWERTIIRDLFNDTDDYTLTKAPNKFIVKQKLYTVSSGQIAWWKEAGITTAGERQVEIYPDDGQTRTIVCEVYNPDQRYSTDSDQIKLPTMPLIYGTWARAIQERGEDAGQPGVDVAQQYRSMLSDAITRDWDKKTILEQKWHIT